MDKKVYLLFKSSIPNLGHTQPSIQWAKEALSPGVKRPKREADHSPPSSAEVKNKLSYTSTSSYGKYFVYCIFFIRQGLCIMKHSSIVLSMLLPVRVGYTLSESLVPFVT
jgi:hypothetical protein